LNVETIFLQQAADLFENCSAVAQIAAQGKGADFFRQYIHNQ
jgi:hypothetical protein